MHSHDDVLAATLQYFDNNDLAASVWMDKYALRDADGNLLELTPDDMHKRMAREFARIEKTKFKNPLSEEEIYQYLVNFSRIIPQGSCMYGIGNKHQYVTLSNCYVLPSPYDSYLGINYLDAQIAQISSRRGGVGWSMSSLRPRNMRVQNAAGSTTGTVSFMHRFSNTIREVCQCIIKGSQVLTKNGLKNIEDIIPEDDSVWTKQGWVKVINIYSRPGILEHGQESDLYEVTTKNGYTISVSLDHVLMVENNGVICEKQLKDLTVGDEIILIPGTTFNNQSNKLIEYIYPKKTFFNRSNKLKTNKLPLVLSENLAYFLGYSYGDGHVEYDKRGDPVVVTLACSNDHPLIKTKLSDIAQQEFEYDINIRDGDGDLKRPSIYSKNILYHLHKNQLLKAKSLNQNFPQKILQASSDIQMAFLAGYFDADGYASGSKKGYVFSSINKPFIKTIQLILIANGIPSKLYCENRENKGWANLYSLCVVGKYAQELLCKLCIHSIKIQQKQFVSKKDCWLTPYTAQKNHIKYGNYNYINNVDNISAQAYQRLKKDGVDLYNMLLKDTIVSINQIEIEDTYDLELESEHLFWCNGFYVHNSGRRGASLQSLSVKHPEILNFISCKNDDVSITGSNISVEFYDEFMQSLDDSIDYELQWPVNDTNPKIRDSINNQSIWSEFIHNTWKRAEPGAIFMDTVHRRSTSAVYPGFEEVAPNPCAEQYLPAYGCCRLLALVLYSYVVNKFTPEAYFDFEKFVHDVKIMQRLADNVVDLDLEAIDRIIAKIESDPEPPAIKQIGIDLWNNIKARSIQDRRTGCGVLGLADMLAALDIKYDSDEAIVFCDTLFRTFKLAAYTASVEMAEELGAFPVYSSKLDRQSEFIQDIQQEDPALYKRMQKSGRRNMTLLTIAPTGSVSIVADVSSGLEPVFKIEYTRRKKTENNNKIDSVDFIDAVGDKWLEYKVYHRGFKDWQQITNEINMSKSPYYMSCAHEIDFRQKIKLQATIQKHIDNSISVTTNLPADIDEHTVSDLYKMAWKLGCKGFTIYRDGSRSGVLISDSDNKPMPVERPRELPCDVHHITIRGQQYFVLVGLINNQPYEVFAGKNGFLSKKVKTGIIIRKRKGFYKAKFDDSDEELAPITASTDEMEDIISRLTSGLLRTGADMHFIVQQLEKVGERQTEMNSFARSVARALKKYIPDGTKEDDECPECTANSLFRQEGCITCKSCGFSKCL